MSTDTAPRRHVLVTGGGRGLGAEAERTGRVEADADVDVSIFGKQRGADPARLAALGEHRQPGLADLFVAMMQRPGSAAGAPR